MFHDKLKEERKSKGLSLSAAALLAGISRHAICEVEAGRGDVRNVDALMRILKVTLSGKPTTLDLGKQLEARRLGIDLSREDLSEGSGLDVQTVEALERGQGKTGELNKVLARLAVAVTQFEKDEQDCRFVQTELLEAITASFGPISLDPCGDIRSPVVAKRMILKKEGGDGLLELWSGRLAFVNPPYQGMADWLQKGYDEWCAKRVSIVLILVPGSAGSNFFMKTGRPEARVFHFERRIAFTNTDKVPKTQSSKTAMMLVCYGTTFLQRARFERLVGGTWAKRDHGAGVFVRVLTATTTSSTYENTLVARVRVLLRAVFSWLTGKRIAAVYP